MPRMTRRAFAAATTTLPAANFAAETGTTANVDETLRSGIANRQIPAVVAMAADRSKALYSGAFGVRDPSGVPVGLDSIFRIASMTKAITTVAALQLVEQGKVNLDEPAAKHLPKLASLQVLEGFDSSGKPVLRPAKTQVTLRHLLTHTCGFCYGLWDEKAFRYDETKPSIASGDPYPLMFEPGTRWQYGQGVDWAGRLVESLSQTTLEDYFQKKILGPLGMIDTSYILPEEKFGRLVSSYRRDATGVLQANERKLPSRPKNFNGGGGLFSTAADYTRFMQMILLRGAGPGSTKILNPKTVQMMATNQIGSLSAGKMRSFNHEGSADVDMQPGHTEGWGLGFLINTTAYAGGRSAGSLAWAGFDNTFYWIDPKRERCGVILMQFLPFVDRQAIGLLSDFESSVYRNF